MRFALLIIRFLRAYDGAQSQFFVHIFMNRCRAKTISYPFKINSHAPIAIHTIMIMIDFRDLFLYFGFLGIVFRLPVLPVVVISIRIDFQPT